MAHNMLFIASPSFKKKTEYYFKIVVHDNVGGFQMRKLNEAEYRNTFRLDIGKNCSLIASGKNCFKREW